MLTLYHLKKKERSVIRFDTAFLPFLFIVLILPLPLLLSFSYFFLPFALSVLLLLFENCQCHFLWIIRNGNKLKTLRCFNSWLSEWKISRHYTSIICLKYLMGSAFMRFIWKIKNIFRLSWMDTSQTETQQNGKLVRAKGILQCHCHSMERLNSRSF